MKIEKCENYPYNLLKDDLELLKYLMIWHSKIQEPGVCYDPMFL